MPLYWISNTVGAPPTEKQKKSIEAGLETILFFTKRIPIKTHTRSEYIIAA